MTAQELAAQATAALKAEIAKVKKSTAYEDLEAEAAKLEAAIAAGTVSVEASAKAKLGVFLKAHIGTLIGFGGGLITAKFDVIYAIFKHVF